MYQSCLVCRSSLGVNEVVSGFPVGSRLAYSLEEGRLWAICNRCGEWNLAPIEERWEAVQECEELYEGAVRRGAVDGMALARLEDVTLIRVGDRSDLPTLRYASRLRKRSARSVRRKRAYFVGRGVVAVIAATAGAFTFGAAGMVLGLFVASVGLDFARDRAGRVVAEVLGAEGQAIPVTQGDLRDARLVPSSPHERTGWSLRIRKGTELRGDVAVRAVRILAPLLNRSDEPELMLGQALRYIDRKGGTLEGVFSAAARRRGSGRTARIARLDPHIRLALEIVAGAETEARALSADLAPLKEAWRHAEEMAEIQDDLAFELGVVEKIGGAE